MSDRIGNIIELAFSKGERNALLRSTLSVKRWFGRQLKGSKKQGTSYIVRMDLETAESLLHALESDLSHVADEGERRKLLKASDRIRETLGEDEDEAPSPFEGGPGEIPDALKEALEEIAGQAVEEGLTYNELMEDEEGLKARLEEYVLGLDEPDEELGGLAPNQMFRLINYGWWKEPYCIHVNDRLPGDELERLPIIYNTRLLLQLLMEEGRVKATNAGNLNRKTVKRMLDEGMNTYGRHLGRFMQLDPLMRDYLKVFNEEDVPFCHIPRVIAGLAGLIARTSTRFYIIDEGAWVARPENMGRLFARLFHTFFRSFNLAYCDMMPDLYSELRAFPYTLYLISRLDEGEWVLINGREEDYLHPVLVQEVRDHDNPHFTIDFVLRVRYLEKLEGFGLLELYEGEAEAGSRQGPIYFRKTPLFDRFLFFDLPNGPVV
ncbi:MAG: hypothetical protein K9L28_10725 [Synergistales bacterium]|nr:hypothetical protein [Synergistales bacterium]